MVGFVFAVLEDFPPYPVRAFLVGASAVRALVRLEVSEMLEDEDTGPMLLRKLDNAATDQVRVVLIEGAHLRPQPCVVLFASGNDAGFASIASYSGLCL